MQVENSFLVTHHCRISFSVTETETNESNFNRVQNVTRSNDWQKVFGKQKGKALETTYGGTRRIISEVYSYLVQFLSNSSNDYEVNTKFCQFYKNHKHFFCRILRKVRLESCYFGKFLFLRKEK